MPGERIRVKTIEGKWEWLGRDRYPSVKPGIPVYSFDGWGPSGVTVPLQRDPNLDYGDLQEFTDLDVMVGERVAWSGYIIDTPGVGGDDPGLTINGLGWQHHLDEDLYEPLYCLEDLARWIDARALADRAVGAGGNIAEGQVIAGGDSITLLLPPGTYTANDAVSIVLDAGPGNTWIELGWTGTGSANDTNVALDANLLDGLPGGAAFTTLVTSTLTALGAAFGPTSFLSGTPRRYLMLRLRFLAGATTTADRWVKFTRLAVAPNTLYVLGGLPNVLASDVLADAVKHAPRLSQSTAGITATTLAIAAAWPGEDRSPRQVAEYMNAFHGYRLRVGGPELRSLEFGPLPNRPLLTVTTGRDGARFADASTNSGRESYNRVIARGNTGGGKPLVVERMSDSPRDYVLAPGFSNPTADVDGTGWSVSDGSVGRTTTAPYLGAGSFLFATSAAGILAATNQFALAGAGGGSLKAGKTYRFRLAGRLLAAGVFLAARIQYGPSANDKALIPHTDQPGATFTTVVSHAGLDPLNTWIVREVLWQQPFDYASPTITLDGGGGVPLANMIQIDEVRIGELSATPMDARGFRRTKSLTVTFPIDRVALTALADAYLAVHQRAPLKGTLEVSSPDAVRTIVGERPVPVDELGRYTGELVNLANLIDPDTGALGRLGIVAGVSVEGERAQVAIDNARDLFDALLARMGVRLRG